MFLIWPMFGRWPFTPIMPAPNPLVVDASIQ
jgi:hypothetical protein